MNEWIKIEDRFPDEGVPVWGAAISQYPLSMMMVCLEYYNDGWLWENVISYYLNADQKWECDSEMDDDYSWITHWMPLPNPPRITT